MDKSEDAFRTISEAAEDLDLPQHVLRFWETRFPQIRPLKRGGGRRYYRPDDVELLRAIRHLLYNEGYTIKGVQRMLKERGVRSVLNLRSEPSLDSRDAPSQRTAEGARSASAWASSDLESVRSSALEERANGGRAAASRAPAEEVVAMEGEAPPEPMSDGAAFAPRRQPFASAVPAERALENRKRIEAVIAELAECRRILGAANI
jgi:DNA-binding transcriptional MerR regulator